MKLSQKEYDALVEIVSLGSENKNFSYQREIYTSEEYVEWCKNIQDSAFNVLDRLKEFVDEPV